MEEITVRIVTVKNLKVGDKVLWLNYKVSVYAIGDGGTVWLYTKEGRIRTSYLYYYKVIEKEKVLFT